MENTNQQTGQTSMNSGMHVFLIQHAQHIHRLIEELESNSFAFGLKLLLSVILQVLCYLLFAFAIYLAIIIPSDFSSLMDMMSEERSAIIDVTLNIPQLNDFLLGMKITLAVISLPVLICALLLGRNRRKSMQMRRALKEAEQMKANYDENMRTLRF